MWAATKGNTTAIRRAVVYTISITLMPKFLNDCNNLKERRTKCVIREVL